jgi:YspA, cpYpsA-related SLOG family
MKVLVCGGRRFNEVSLLNDTLNTFRSSISVLISGNARGADQLGEQWAKTNGVEIDRYPAQWDIYGKSAGFRRNEQMLREGKPNVVIAFRGGAGTAHMVRTAKAANIKVWEIS